jgi:hypothetical protein
MFWLVSLPFRLAFGLLLALVLLPIAIVVAPFALLLWLPFLIVKFALRLAFGLLLLPLVLLVGFIGLFAVGAAAFAMFLPLLFIGMIVGGIWLLVRPAAV